MPDLWAELHPNDHVPPSMPTEYPKWVGGKIVHSRADEDAALRGEEPSPVPQVNRLMALAEPEIGEKALLQLEAQNMGIEVDRRWGINKLRKLIHEHR